MYFLNYQPIKKRLQERSVSDREALPYLISYIVILSIPNSLPPAPGYNFWDGIAASISLIIAIIGILNAYNKNGGETGYDFIHKFAILGWVVFFRFFLCSIPMLCLSIFVGIKLGVHSSEQKGPFIVIVLLLFQCVFFQRVGRHIKDTNK